MYIAGPSVCFKLINKDHHELILFGEIHNDLKNQHECHISSENLRIDQYLIKEFKKNKKPKTINKIDRAKHFSVHTGR